MLNVYLPIIPPLVFLCALLVHALCARASARSTSSMPPLSSVSSAGTPRVLRDLRPAREPGRPLSDYSEDPRDWESVETRLSREGTCRFDGDSEDPGQGA